MATAKLSKYQQMRDFSQTAEPSGANAQVTASNRRRFVMEGGRLHGSWVLVRLRDDAKSKRHNWLLIKHRDEGAVEGEGGALAAEDRSIASGRSMAEIAAGKGKGAKPFMTAKATEADA